MLSGEKLKYCKWFLAWLSFTVAFTPRLFLEAYEEVDVKDRR